MSATGVSMEGPAPRRARPSRRGAGAWARAALGWVALAAPTFAGNVEIGGAKVKTFEWLSYGPEIHMVADLHMTNAGPQPLVVFLHGGGSVATPIAMKFEPQEAPYSHVLDAGFSILSAHYGSSVLGVVYPEQNASVRQLLRWVNEILLPSAPGHFDGNVVLWGTSHGGLLAMREAFGGELKEKYRPDLVAAWAAPTYLPFFDQSVPTQLATHFTGEAGSTLSEIPWLLQAELSPAAVLHGHGGKKLPTFAAYWTSPGDFPAGTLLDPHDGTSGALLSMVYPGVELSFYEDVIGPLPEDGVVDPSFPVDAMITWIRDELEE